MRLSPDAPMARSLIDAIHSGEVETLRQLLAQNPALAKAHIGTEVEGKTRSLLHIATDWPGHFPRGAESIAVLIAAGADVNARCNGETPLHWAASCDDVPCLDALLDGGAEIEATGAVITGGTPMSDAVVFAQWNAARRLVERGAQTTFWQSAALGLLARVEAFFAKDPSPSLAEITNAFWNACRGGHRPTAEYLLTQGADPNWIGHDRLTPLGVAERDGQPEVAAWLRGLGAR